MMTSDVDVFARRNASQLFRDFISGRISNDEFEDGRPVTHDRAVGEIWDTSWVFYDDLKTHRLKGKYRLPADQRKACVRWLLFLHSELSYEWPELYLPGIDPATRIQSGFWRRVFSLHQDLSDAKAQRFLSAGHFPVWPFIRVSDYKKALSSPKFLAGRSLATPPPLTPPPPQWHHPDTPDRRRLRASDDTASPRHGPIPWPWKMQKTRSTPPSPAGASAA